MSIATTDFAHALVRLAPLKPAAIKRDPGTIPDPYALSFAEKCSYYDGRWWGCSTWLAEVEARREYALFSVPQVVTREPTKEERESTAPVRFSNGKHGTNSTYQSGCKCAPCRAAHTIDASERRRPA